MERIQGKPISGGVAVGKIYYYSGKAIVYDKKMDIETEISRFRDAKKTALEQLQKLYEKALEEVGAGQAGTFEAYRMILEGEGFANSVENMIRNDKTSAECAVYRTGEMFALRFTSMKDEYMSARAEDIKDISGRVVRILQGIQDMEELREEPVLLFADELTPSEIISIGKKKLLALVTKTGSVNSHTAILARLMNVPFLIDIDILPEWNGEMAIVDAVEGVLYIRPDEEILREKLIYQTEEIKKRQAFQELKNQETVTKDGKKIRLCANVGSVEEVEGILENDGEGIGLFRSEFLYLQKNCWPTEEEQFIAYKTAAEKMKGRKVIIRTFDLGGDKQISYLHLPKEENPAMGLRGVRIYLKQPEIFKTQLRALYRASVFGDIAIMFPMITSVWEVQEIKKIIAEVKEGLDRAGISYGDVELGVMIETPAAVMISEELSREMDFLSIGTNDLTQYALAADRQNHELSRFYDVHHPAVMKMIQMTIDNGHKQGARVGICGELGVDKNLIETFVRMGIDELSVPAAFILPIRDIIRSFRL